MMIRRLLIGALLGGASMLAWALPSVQQVEAEVAKGRYAQAESMMAEVVAAKPGSARAHYVYAEILAHNELYARAAEQARLARTLDPTLAFAGSPDTFRSFERLVEREQTGAANAQRGTPRQSTDASTAPIVVKAPSVAAAPAPASGVPSWLWGAGFAIAAVLLWRAISRRPAAAAAGSAASKQPGAMAANAPYGTTVGAPGTMAPSAGGGGGLLGAGLAGAGGFAAGMMVDRMLHRNDGASGTSGVDHLSNLGPAAGGNFVDPPDELAGRSVDFGNGGNDWGDGGGNGGSSAGDSDSGGSSGGGGWDS